MRKLLFLLFTIFPAFLAFNFSWASSHSVVINEIGWMGTQTYYGDEWIELFNSTSEAIDLTAWTLKAVDGTPNIALSGLVSAGSYFLLERTDDTTIPDISADQIYAGALGDDGEDLELRDPNSNLIDSIPAGAEWFAGDKNSRRSMERTDALSAGSDPSNWHTSAFSPGTPKAANSTPVEESQPEESNPQINFSAPSSVVADTSFSVSINLSNFDPGTYALKVLVGDGTKFYDGRTQGVSGEWLAWNAPWAEFPKVAVGSSGSASKAVSAKADEDAAGAYQIMVRVRREEDGKTFDSGAQPVSVSAKPQAAESSEEETGEPRPNDSSVGRADGVSSSENSEVLGIQQKAQVFRPNFYLGVGIFGVLVGLGGIAYALRDLWMPSLREYLKTLKSKESGKEILEDD